MFRSLLPFALAPEGEPYGQGFRLTVFGFALAGNLLSKQWFVSIELFQDDVQGQGSPVALKAHDWERQRSVTKCPLDPDHRSLIGYTALNPKL